MGSMLVATVALAGMPLAQGRVSWLAFVFLTLACIGVWGGHGPLLSWPAAILDGTAAAAGPPPPPPTPPLQHCLLIQHATTLAPRLMSLSR